MTQTFTITKYFETIEELKSLNNGTIIVVYDENDGEYTSWKNESGIGDMSWEDVTYYLEENLCEYYTLETYTSLKGLLEHVEKD